MTTESWVITTPTTQTLGDVKSLSISIIDGLVEVIGKETDDGAKAVVEQMSARPLDITSRDRDVRIGYDFTGVDGLVERARGLKDSDRVDLRVTVPANVPVKISTVRARVKVEDVTGGVTVTTATGAVSIDDTRGSVAARTASAPIEVSDHTGDLNLTTASGSVKASGALGRVVATSVSGAMEFAAKDSLPLVTTRTVAGDVAVRLRAGAPVNIKANHVAGKVVLDGEALEGRSVTHADEHGQSTAYVSAVSVSGGLTVSRG